MDIGILITFLLYFVFLFTIGFYYFKRSKDLSDYILGGRTLNGYVTALSAQASDMSGWLLLGLPGAAYVSGISASWIAIGLLVGTYINWKFVARRFRIYTEQAGDAITIPDYLEHRFQDSSKVLRVIAASFILFFFLIYTSSGFVAGATLFNNVFGLDYQLALIIGALIVISYTFLGGYLAVCWTDFFQGILMLCAILIVPVAGVVMMGGLADTSQALNNVNPYIMNMMIDMDGSKLTFVAIISSLAWGFGYFGQPHILTRFMGIRHADEIKQSRRIAMIWVTLSLTAAIFVGVVGRVVIPDLSDPETIFMTLVATIFHPAVGGILLAAILAAIMSTADSQLLVTASAISEDFYKVLIRKNAGDKELVLVSRITVIVVAMIAYFIARDPGNSVMGLVSYAWAGFGATFGPIIILSLYWRGMNKWGALAGIVLGGLTTIIFKFLNTGLYEIVPGFIVATIAVIFFSVVTKGPKTSVSESFDVITKQY